MVQCACKYVAHGITKEGKETTEMMSYTLALNQNASSFLGGEMSIIKYKYHICNIRDILLLENRKRFAGVGRHL